MTRGAPLPARDSTRTSPAPSRRDALRWAGLAGLGVAGAGTLGACANRAEPPPARDLITPTTVDPPLVDGMITSDVERRSEERRVGKECRSRWARAKSAAADARSRSI